MMLKIGWTLTSFFVVCELILRSIAGQPLMWWSVVYFVSLVILYGLRVVWEAE